MTYRTFAYDTLGSTNDEAMARLKAGDPGGFFVTAARQTSGRGRQGRTWQSPPGNLYASFGLIDPAPPALAPQLGFVAGIALHAALAERLPADACLAIKWPNDILLAGAKLAGILIECTTLTGGALACVIGFGVNCRWHPEGLPYPATDLATAGDVAAAPEPVMEALAIHLARALAAWRRGADFAAIRSTWLSHAAGLGRPMSIVTARGTVHGVFEGLDAMGRLRLATGNRTIKIEAGDVCPVDASGGKAMTG